MAEVIVLGAGIVGISVAIHLQRRGRSVLLLDRREPGSETSHGNAGIIQQEAVRPYAFPRDLATLLRIVGNRRIDARYHWRAVSPRRWPATGGIRPRNDTGGSSPSTRR